MKVLIVGGGGREHALAWRLRHEVPTAEILAAPGNPGIAELSRCVPVGALAVDALVNLARREQVDWTLVGPEAPLEAGLADAFGAEGLPIFGPTKNAAQLETSKAFAKSVMAGAGVPTANAITCSSPSDAIGAIRHMGAPVVIKASGLAAGKGVIVCHTVDEALAAAKAMLEAGAFGAAGSTVLVEEYMEGEEVSLFLLTDGRHVVPLPPAQDHKRLLDGDRGPNTGGMGAYCPLSVLERSPGLLDDVVERVALPTLHAMRLREMPFTGLLYVGLMLTADGPKVVEFNCRYGDPETQAVLPALSDGADLFGLMAAVARGERLPPGAALNTSRAAVTTVLAAAGYPEQPRAGDRIELPAAPGDTLVFHAGTRRADDGSLVTSGGRVLAVTGLGESIEEAQQRSQSFAAAVSFAGKQFRTDIGWRELTRSAGTP
ncbi:MAG: phosphoribosylamine--glycine ligase [Gemmatimonadaceae bacterium]